MCGVCVCEFVCVRGCVCVCVCVCVPKDAKFKVRPPLKAGGEEGKVPQEQPGVAGHQLPEEKKKRY